MKNITISLDDAVYRKARIRAAEQGTSVSSLFRNYLLILTGENPEETEFLRLQREEQKLREELRARNIGLNPAYNISRDELHDRNALR